MSVSATATGIGSLAPPRAEAVRGRELAALAHLPSYLPGGVGADMLGRAPADCWSTWRLTLCLVATASLLDPAR